MTSPSARDLTELYKETNLVELAKQLPHARRLRTGITKFLIDSNLLRMGDWVSQDVVTWGADPEFILCKKDNENDIVLFSSEYAGLLFGLSEANVGADYGLLEFRPPVQTDTKGLVKEMENLHREFKARYSIGDKSQQVSYQYLKILEKEAVEFNHKRQRIKETMNKGSDIDYGTSHKDASSFCSSGEDHILTGMETDVTLCAYDTPVFSQFNPNLLTAGGHIHIGGALIKMLSFKQLKLFVRKLDKEVLPICQFVETKAGELRRTVYGAPGEFRIKDYGIEYRSPSNAIFFQKNLGMLEKALEKAKEILFTMALK